MFIFNDLLALMDSFQGFELQIYLVYFQQLKGIGCPQGFMGYETKGDITVFNSYPHTLPHSRNKNSYPDCRVRFRTFSGAFGQCEVQVQFKVA